MALKFEQKHLVRVLLVLLSITILIGVAIMIYFLLLSSDDDTIKLDITANGQKSITFEDLSLIPGEKKEYAVALRSDIPGDYVLNLDFVEEEPEGTLKQFVYAKLEIGDEVICDSLLEELFEDGPLTIASYLSKRKGCDIKITYYMPIEIGNEAENAIANFMIAVSTVKENE